MLLDESQRMRIMAANDSLTQDALRVLGLAYRVLPELPDELDARFLEHELVFAGLIGMIDPPRPEVPPALNKARHAGIRTIMITGDYPNTARAIAESIGLLEPGHQVLTGPELAQLNDEALQREVEYTDVFARVSPEHKLRIVEALRARDQVVAMTGDGVNDAPAIKRADIGVAMGITGTDVAKESSDMVLTDDNYASIVSAVEQGRIIYANIRKFVFFLLSSNVAEIMIIFLATWGLPTPQTVIQLWLNPTDGGAWPATERRSRYDGSAAAPIQRTNHQSQYAAGHRHPNHHPDRGDISSFCNWLALAPFSRGCTSIGCKSSGLLVAI
jgi:Ca2+-transporting ATPase